eukprot:scaffold302545_cov29-Prasinocladus_malaysianus.AAC.3
MAQQNRLAFDVPLGASAPTKEETAQSMAPQNHRNDFNFLTGKTIDTYCSSAFMRLATAFCGAFSPFHLLNFARSYGVQAAVY